MEQTVSSTVSIRFDGQFFTIIDERGQETATLCRTDEEKATAELICVFCRSNSRVYKPEDRNQLEKLVSQVHHRSNKENETPGIDAESTGSYTGTLTSVGSDGESYVSGEGDDDALTVSAASEISSAISSYVSSSACEAVFREEPVVEEKRPFRMPRSISSSDLTQMFLAKTTFVRIRSMGPDLEVRTFHHLSFLSPCANIGEFL